MIITAPLVHPLWQMAGFSESRRFRVLPGTTGLSQVRSVAVPRQLDERRTGFNEQLWASECRLCRGEFNRSPQHHLIRKDEEVSYGDVADLVYVSAEG